MVELPSWLKLMKPAFLDLILIECQALAQAAEGSPDDRRVFRLCYAVIFFGVPNRGLESSSLNSMVKGQPNEDLVRDLHPNSSFLSMLHQRFLDKFVLEDSKIICIYETNYTATVEVSHSLLYYCQPLLWKNSDAKPLV